MRLQEVRTPGGGKRKRPGRKRRPRGDAPSLVLLHFLFLAALSLPFFLLLPSSSRYLYPVRAIPRTDPTVISRFPLFARATVIFCGNPQMWLARIRVPAHVSLSQAWLARVCEKPDQVTPVRRALSTALLLSDGLIKKNRSSGARARADISCLLCS